MPNITAIGICRFKSICSVSKWEVHHTYKCADWCMTNHVQDLILSCMFLRSFSHWGRVTHIYISKLTIIDSDDGFSLGRRQAIILINTRILFILTQGTNFGEILSGIHSFSFKKMHLKMSSTKWRLFCLGLNDRMHWVLSIFQSHPCFRVCLQAASTQWWYLMYHSLYRSLNLFHVC